MKITRPHKPTVAQASTVPSVPAARAAGGVGTPADSGWSRQREDALLSRSALLWFLSFSGGAATAAFLWHEAGGLLAIILGIIVVPPLLDALDRITGRDRGGANYTRHTPRSPSAEDGTCAPDEPPT